MLGISVYLLVCDSVFCIFVDFCIYIYIYFYYLYIFVFCVHFVYFVYYLFGCDLFLPCIFVFVL